MEAIKEAIFSEYMPFIAYVLFRSLVLFAVGLGSVYIVGRMLGFINSNRGRNAVASATMAGGSIWTTLIYDGAVIVHPDEYIWRPIVYLTVASLLYVLIGFKFAGRIDNVLNKKMAESSDETNNTQKKEDNEDINKKGIEKLLKDAMKKFK